MKTLEPFNQSSTMALVGNNKGHCYGMSAFVADYVINNWNTLEGGEFLGPFLSKFIRERKKTLKSFAEQSELIQSRAEVGSNRGTYLYLLDFRLPGVKEKIMVDAGHAFVLGVLLGVGDAWDEIVLFEPNYGVLECDISESDRLDIWWTEYCRTYKGMGLVQGVNVFNKHVV